MIALIDYGMGNIHSVTKALERVGGEVRRVTRPEGLSGCARIVIPGVGAFRDCMATLRARGLDAALIDAAAAGVPLLGICLGMQILLSRSYEFGVHMGLGLIDGTVEPFPDSLPAQGCKIPHMGWNDIEPTVGHPVLDAIAGRQLYFVHSYFCRPYDDTHLLARCRHGTVGFAAAIGRGHLLGVQFHPEKSQSAGLDLLRAFVTWRP
ncbi:MAG: imidazole glycerol phosphate synthase subunit HisH [Zetaproteobacteria bacterium]|nr:MAG: imidazole glycerol phosphate synthase subunit HisH [Zetaproteobacteria bacterium]